MKKKFLICTLCFTLLFSSFNFNRAYSDSISSRISPVVLTPQIVGLIGSYAVACNIVFNNYNEIVNVAHSFYNSNKENWSYFTDLVSTGVSIGKDKVVSIGKEVKTYLDDFFEVYFSESKVVQSPVVYNQKFYVGGKDSMYQHGDTAFYTKSLGLYGYVNGQSDNVGTLEGYLSHGSGNTWYGGFRVNGVNYGSIGMYANLYVRIGSPDSSGNSTLKAYNYSGNSSYDCGTFTHFGSYPTGTYDSSSVDSNVLDNGSVGIYVPGNVKDLVGVPSGSTVYDGSLNPPYDLPFGGSVSMPSVDSGLVVPGVDSPYPEVSDTDVPDIPTDTPTDKPIIPAFPSFGDSLDFSPLELTNVTEKFPFSLPWDIKRLVDIFDVDPVPPIFEVPFLGEEVIFDLTQFTEWASISRFFTLIGFILSLILISTKLLG